MSVATDVLEDVALPVRDKGAGKPGGRVDMDAAAAMGTTKWSRLKLKNDEPRKSKLSRIPSW
jgi:hypothetical protein